VIWSLAKTLRRRETPAFNRRWLSQAYATSVIPCPRQLLTSCVESHYKLKITALKKHLFSQILCKSYWVTGGKPG
jgi:hypothetical protein